MKAHKEEHQMAHTVREEWLLAAVEELRPMFEAQGAKLPDAIRVTCGFPDRKSTRLNSSHT